MAVPVFMVITGYVSAMSFQTHAHNLKNAYRPTEILRKWLRFVVPFLPIYAFEVVWSYAVLQKSFSKYTLVKFFLEGGDGPGSYYFPVMLQMVVIIPIVCAVIKRFRRKGLIGFFAANVLFEIGKTYGGMNPLTYRLCALRYLFILAFGVYLYYRKPEDKSPLRFIAGAAGAVYIIVFHYTAAVPPITNQWTSTSVFAVLYIVPIMIYLMKQNTIQCKGIELLGRASYDIFLIQMIWYWAAAKYLYEAVSAAALRLAISIPVCTLVGVAFYKIENPVTQWLTGKLKTAAKH